MIIGLIGYAQSGKDTVANILTSQYGFSRLAFADPIKDIAYELNPFIDSNLRLKDLVDEYGWDVAKNKEEVRELIQRFGVSARHYLGEDVWVTSLLRKMDGIDENYVITDVRFNNEAHMLEVIGAELWRVIRPGVGPVNQHFSETELEKYNVKHTLTNDGSLENLSNSIKSLVSDEYYVN